MDELNLGARFGGPEERMPMPMRKRKRRMIPGVGMEKPSEVFEDEEGPDGLEALDEDLGELEEDDAFKDLVDRMAGASASAGRAAKKRKGKFPPARKDEEDEE